MVLTDAQCYRLLGLAAPAPLDEVRRAYRALARRLHPDVAPGQEDRFKEITAAYNRLTGRGTPCGAASPASARPSRPVKRPSAASQARAAADASAHARAWGEWRRRAEAFQDARRGGVAEPEVERGADAPDDTAEAGDTHPPHEADGTHGQEVRGGGERREDAAPGLGARLASVFAGWGRRLREATAAPAPTLSGEDQTLRLPVELDAILSGARRRVAVHRAAACPSCGSAPQRECAVCLGAGRVAVRETVRVSIPPGARAGTRLRLRGKGSAGLAGQADGDLYFLLDPAPIPGFRREGADLHGVVTLDRALAGAGGVVEVRSPRGAVRVTVPVGTRVGDRFRLPAQGLPLWGAAGCGDLFLVVEVA